MTEKGTANVVRLWVIPTAVGIIGLVLSLIILWGWEVLNSAHTMTLLFTVGFWVLLSIHLLQLRKNRQEMPVGQSGGDTSSRAEIDTEAEEANRRYRMAVDHALDAIITFNDQLKIESWNPAAEQIFGWQRAEVVGESLDRFTTLPVLESVSKFGDTDSSSIPLKQTKQVLTGTNKKGERFTIELSLSEGRLQGRKRYVAYIRDIENQVRAEQHLRMSEMKLDMAIRATQLGVWDWNLETDNTTFSYHWMAMLGYEPHELPSRLSTFDTLLHSDDREMTYGTVAKLISGAIPYYQIEFRLKHKQGHWHWVLSSGQVAEKSADGKPLRIIGSHTDIHQMKLNEQSLIASESHIRNVMNSMFALVGIFDYNGNIIEINQSMQDRFRLSNDDVKGKSFTEGAWLGGDPRVAEQMADIIKRANSGEKSRFDVVLYDSNQRPLNVDFQLAPLRDPSGKITHLIASGVEITDRVRVERALQISEARFHAFFEHVPTPVWIVDDNLRHLYVNQAYSALLNQTPSEVIGQTLNEIARSNSIPTKPQIWGTSRFLESSKPTTTQEEVIDQNGKRSQFLVYKFIVPDETETQLAAGIAIDVTEREQKKAQLVQALSEKETLLKEVHHRVKNNLAITASLLNFQYRGTENNEVRSILTETRSRIRTMATVHEILYQSASFSAVDLREYTQSLTEKVLETFDANGRIHPQLSLDQLVVNLDQAIPFGLILNELISNSVKHAYPMTDPGNLYIQLEKLDPNVAQLTVANDGASLPDHFSIENTKSLGLRLIRDLSRQIGGHVQFERRPRTRFTVKFSLMQPPESLPV